MVHALPSTQSRRSATLSRPPYSLRPYKCHGNTLAKLKRNTISSSSGQPYHYAAHVSCIRRAPTEHFSGLFPIRDIKHIGSLSACPIDARAKDSVLCAKYT